MDNNAPLPIMIRNTTDNNQNGNSNNNNNRPISTVSNGQITNSNGARRKSFDVNQTLTYQKVMERVIKRFLLHKQREEQDEIREGDFEELKQDIQMLRFEMMNRLDETREDLAKNSLLLNEGVIVVGELLTTLTQETNPLIKENFFAFKHNFYSTLEKIRSIDSNLDSAPDTTFSALQSVSSTLSMPNLNQNNSSQTILTSSSEPILQINETNESNINPIQAIRDLSAIHATLSNIAEEDETDDDDDDGEDQEIEARHISIQTSPNVRDKF